MLIKAIISTAIVVVITIVSRERGPGSNVSREYHAAGSGGPRCFPQCVGDEHPLPLPSPQNLS